MLGEGATSDVFTSLNQKTGQDSRVRILAQDGKISSQITPFKALDTPVKLTISRYPLTKHMQETRFKTTARDFYDGERARLSALTQADEVIFLNENEQVCEGSFTSLFIQKGGKFLTPALSCGLLAGVLRQEMVEAGDAVEALLKLDDIVSAEKIFIGNSLRGLMPAKFIDFLRH